MATKTIAWDSGSGYITLTYTGIGNAPISVSSDANDLFEDRQQTVQIATTNGSPQKAVNLLVKQKGKTYPVGTVFNYDYTGNVQQITLPKGKYKLQCWGAQGGNVSGSYTATGSKGGYSEGVLTITEPTTIYIFVGGQGTSSSTSSTSGTANGGWNGGGASIRKSSYNSGDTYGESYPRSGGGATDMCLVTSTMNYSSGRTNRSSVSLLSRFIVAGGGAGASARYTEVTETTEGWSNIYSGDSQFYMNSIEDTDGSIFPFENGTLDATTGQVAINPTLQPKRLRTTSFISTSSYTFIKNNSTNLLVNVYYYDEIDGNCVSQSGYTSTDIQINTNYKYYKLLVKKNDESNISVSEGNNIRGLILSWEGRMWFQKNQNIVAGKNYKFIVDNPSSTGTYAYCIQFHNQSGSWISTINNKEAVAPNNAAVMKCFVVTNSFEDEGFSDNACKFYIYEYGEITNTTTSSGNSNSSQQGGGINGKGQYPGTQSSAGNEGNFGLGANQTNTGYRYVAGAGGGGWYGGGTNKSDTSTNYVNYSGGGSGFVNIANNASYRPSGYTGLELDNGSTKDGSTSFESPTGGGTEPGHVGNGYAKITVLE